MTKESPIPNDEVNCTACSFGIWCTFVSLQLTFVILLSLPTQRVQAGPHPFHDEGGHINWRPNWQAALLAAQKTGKPLFIEVANEGDGNCRQLATATLRDPILALTINRHFTPVVIDSGKVPPEIKEMYGRIEGTMLPYLIFVTDHGQFLLGTSGMRNSKTVQADIEEVLKNKALSVPKNKEIELTKQVAALEKALDAKDYKKALSAYQAVQQVHGYHALKDRASDLLDKAQEEGANVLRKAYELARKNEYAAARDALKEFPTKSMTGLPCAAEAKDHLTALKMLEAAYQIATDKKVPNWKLIGLQQLDAILSRYPDTPYATLALVQRKDLAKE
jgi:hypothetical protein